MSTSKWNTSRKECLLEIGSQYLKEVQNALHSAHGNLVHATSLLWDFITKTITTENGCRVSFHEIQTRKKMPESHIKMIEPLIESNYLWKGKKIILHGDIPDESYDNALSGASPFWFYRNRRCQNCDGVRKLGYDQLSDEEKKESKSCHEGIQKGA